MKIQKITIILASIILTGCRSEKTFLETFELKSDATYSLICHVPALILSHPIRMIVLDNQFIIADFEGDTLFTFANKEGESFRFGIQGRGPGEYVDGYGLAMLSDSSFIISDRALKRISFYKIASEMVLKYNEVIVPSAYNIFPYDENLMVTNGQEPFDKNYGVLDLLGDTAYSYIDFPLSTTNDEIPEFAKQRMFYSHIVKKPGSNRFVSFKASQLIVDVMDLNNEELVLVDRRVFAQFQWDKDGNRYSPQSNESLNAITGSRITGSISNIFICYQDLSREDKSWNLLTFTWEGIPQNRNELPFIPYCIFSTPDGTLYCITTIEMEYRIVEVRLDK